MEMHQVRYFLAAVDELNFTKAAEKCNVSQPSLTRAIKQLEGELGGDLFRRERPHAQLTELGERMLPLLKQCYDSAIGARTLASSMKSGEVGALRLALSRSISMELMTPFLHELTRVFKGLQLRLLRGTAAEVLELLKKGEAEFAVAADLGEEWERLDRWPLFTEGFELIVSRANQLAARPALAPRTCGRSAVAPRLLRAGRAAGRAPSQPAARRQLWPRHHLGTRPRHPGGGRPGRGVRATQPGTPRRWVVRRSRGSSSTEPSTSMASPDGSVPRSDRRFQDAACRRLVALRELILFSQRG